MLFAALLVILAAAAQSNYHPYNYMEELRKAEWSVRDKPQAGPQRAYALQLLSFAQSYVGDPALAAVTYASSYQSTPMTPEQQSANAERVQKLLEEYEPREAVAAIVAAAADRQIVILNEAHSAPRHRAFATELALELRKLGFEYLAVETLASRTPETVMQLRKRGYPLVADGAYSKEPLFGDFLRRSLAAGYQPVAYEFTAPVGDFDKLDATERQIQREDGQAQNIIDRVLATNSRARIFVYVGHGHVNKGLSDVNGRKIGMMAERLRVKSGIDPLCIEQALPTWSKVAERDQLLLDRVLPGFSGESFVLASRTGAGYWSGGNVDMQVWHRPPVLMHGRESWLAMRGYRRPKTIPVKLLPREGRRLVQAFVAGESADAVPMDQLVVSAGEAPPKFMLPKGKYRFAYQD